MNVLAISSHDGGITMLDDVVMGAHTIECATVLRRWIERPP